MRIVADGSTGRGKGRPRRFYPEFLCPRVFTLHRIFAFAMPKADWARMHRCMANLYDPVEEGQRRTEYSKTLQALAYSDLIGRCDPADESGYPGGILAWQYEEGLLGSRISANEERSIMERRSEYARKLALFLVAREARMSMEYLRKLCHRWDPTTSAFEPVSED